MTKELAKELQNQGKVPHLMTVHPRNVIVLVINVIEEHNRIEPLNKHSQMAFIFEVSL